VTLEPERSSGGGLYVAGKDKVVYIPQERKSRLGILFSFLHPNMGHSCCMEVIYFNNIIMYDAIDK